jgi:AraC-like DNA-binding protein
MFHVHTFNPHANLRQYVESYLLVSVDQPELGFVENSFFPNFTQRLVIGLDSGKTIYDCKYSEFCAPNYIVGPNDAIRRIRMCSGMRKMMILFKPGGLYKIFRLPAHLFNNRTRDATEFLGRQVPEIGRQITEMPLSGKIELMDGWLMENLQSHKKDDRSIDHALQLIEQNNGNISLRELEHATFTTKRTLERHFLEQIGLLPKSYSRLVRFNSVIRFLESNLNVKWQQLADVFGYYDQSHFINEFKTLTGGLPQNYFLLKTGREKMMQV